MSKTQFSDGIPSQGIKGTVVTAAFLNAVNNHHHTGADEDGHGAIAYAADTGGVNALVVALDPPLAQLYVGMPLWFKVANSNTGPATLNLNGLGAKNIRKFYNQPLIAGDLIANAIVSVIYDGANFQLITPRDALTLAGQAASYYLSRANHTGSQSITTLSDHNKAAHDALGIDAATLAGQASSYYRNRANHTGSQPISTLSDHNKAAHDALGIDAATVDGKHFQSGKGVTAGSPTAELVVTFSPAFTSVPVLTATAEGAGSGAGYIVAIASISATQAALRAYEHNGAGPKLDITINWMASGV